MQWLTFLKSKTVSYLIAAVWILFALLGKLLPAHSSHQQIVARVFGEAQSLGIVRLIGIGELLIALWIVSGYKKRWCGIFQMAVVVTMNCIELLVARDLLMWGRLNALFALLFVLAVYINLVSPEGEANS